MKPVVLAVLAVLAHPAASPASTVARDGGVLVFTATPGESTSLRVYVRDGRIRFAEGVGAVGGTSAPGGPVAGAGCEQDGAEVACPAEGVETVRATLGDGADELQVKPDVAGSSPPQWRLPVPLEVHLGDGDDTHRFEATPQSPLVVFGGAGNDRMGSGNADDRLDGGPGDDHFDGSPGADRFAGGEGDDTFRWPGPDADVSCGPGADSVSALLPGATLGDGCPPSFELLPVKGSPPFPTVRLRFGRATGPATGRLSMRDDRPGASKRFRLTPGRTTTITWRLKRYAHQLRVNRCVGPQPLSVSATDAEGNRYEAPSLVWLYMRRGRVSYAPRGEWTRLNCRTASDTS